jgi:hypothetical protein
MSRVRCWQVNPSREVGFINTTNPIQPQILQHFHQQPHGPSKPQTDTLDGSTSNMSNPLPAALSRIGPIQIGTENIIIRDVGIGLRSEAFYWLVMGHHVCDSSWKEITVYDLERDMDPHGMMDPVCLRRALWASLPYHLWGGPDLEPQQPGMDARHISKFALTHTSHLGLTQTQAPTITSAASPPLNLRAQTLDALMALIENLLRYLALQSSSVLLGVRSQC